MILVFPNIEIDDVSQFLTIYNMESSDLKLSMLSVLLASDTAAHAIIARLLARLRSSPRLGMSLIAWLIAT